MKNPAASAENRDVVVFHIWKSLAYSRRMVISFLLILSGMAVQAVMTAFFPGCAFVLLGSLLLVVRGYDNRVQVGKFAPDASWEKVDRSKFLEVERLHRDMRRWDRSLLDITNKLGFFVFAVMAAVIGISVMQGMETRTPVIVIISGDAALLLFPHWFTGIRSILTQPLLILKIETFQKVLKPENRPWLAGVDVGYFMLMKGGEAKIPGDVKIRLGVKNQPRDFLGLYGQVVANTVNGNSYPYFYVVLVARKGFGLSKIHDAFSPPKNITKEFKVENDVEVLVIRQTTTRTSGYHTKEKQTATILAVGLDLARRAVEMKK
jgi:hypothetical protein